MSLSCRDTRERITRYLDAELPTDGRAGMDAHLSGCARCRAEMDEAREWRAAWKGAPRLASTAADRAAILTAAEPLLEAADRARLRSRAVTDQTRWRAPSRWFAPTASDLVTVGALAMSVVLSLALLGRIGPDPGPRARSGPVLSLAEFVAREEGRVIDVGGTFSMADPLEWRGIAPSPRRMR